MKKDSIKADYPLGIIAVYDSPDYEDRYAIFFSRIARIANPGKHFRITYSEFSTERTRGEDETGAHNGKMIPFKHLPKECQKLVKMELD